MTTPFPPLPEAEPHVRAIMDALEAGLPASIGVALGVGAAKPPPYIAVYPDIGTLRSQSLRGDRSRMLIRFTINHVAVGPEQALWCADKVRGVLLDRTPPAVAGRVTQRLWQAWGAPGVERDSTVQPALYIATAEYSWSTQAARVTG